MPNSHYDVAIVGAGCAGLSAAIGLAKAGFSVVVLEAAAFPGAENWSGCVYFCENLAHPSLLGPDGVEALAWERRLVERGFFMGNGHSLLGMTYRDPDAFRHCYTVLRPIYDHHLAQMAVQAGVVLLNNTTAESLIRMPDKSTGGSRIVGVATHRGPVYADLTFLAEGDASHLVTREGYERSNDPRQQPKFLQGIKQIIDMPPGAVEENFGLGAEEGAAYEILLRNGSLRGQTVRLNMGGFVYTNRQSLSIGLVLPAENLHEHFGGDPNLLMEWFENMPDLQRWCKGGTRGVFGAKIIRGGGAKDIPHLVDNGLAIGGAASAIGVDFPYPNFTGPATRMGLLLVEAAKVIRQAGGSFTQVELEQHYLEPLKETRYWKDVEFLKRWPGYVEKTQFFFGRNVDLALGTAYIWTRPKKWLPSKWINWVKMLLHVAGPGRWGEMLQDARQLRRALRVGEVAGRLSPGQLLINGWVNSLRDLCRVPRKDVPPAGELAVAYSVSGGAEPIGPPPKLVRRWFRRFAPVLAAAARHVYTNDDTPLDTKLRAANSLLIDQVNLFDLLIAGLLGVAGSVTAAGVIAWEWFKQLIRRIAGRSTSAPSLKGFYPQYVVATRQAGELTGLVPQAAQKWEDRLGQLSYQTDRRSHIHLLWPQQLEKVGEVAKAGLWHVCPAHVYEARVSPMGQLQVVVNFENCIKCETCWRTSDLVDWGRDGRHRFIYPVSSPAVDRLMTSLEEAGGTRAALSRALDWWVPTTHALAEQLQRQLEQVNGQDTADLAVLEQVLAKLERKLEQLEEALTEEPRTMDRARSDHLEMLARYAQQLAEQLAKSLRQSPLAASPVEAMQTAHRELLNLAHLVAGKVAEIVRRAEHRKFSWAAADGRHIRQHHLEGFRCILRTLVRHMPLVDDPCRGWLLAERHSEEIAAELDPIVRRLDEVFPPQVWRDLEKDGTLTPVQDEELRKLVAQVPLLNLAESEPLHPPIRKVLLAELARRDPSLAFRVACHLWARDLGQVSGVRSQEAAASRFLAFAVIENGRVEDGNCFGEALFVPAAEDTLLLVDNRLFFLPVDAPGLRRERLETLGFRGAKLQRIVLDGMPLPEAHLEVNRDEVLRAWHILSSADLTSMAFGMADQLTRRAVDHAMSRVQFPGLFFDEQARDSIGKFGAVKKLVAEMGARRFLLETLDHNLSPRDFSAASAERAALVKALAAEALGTAPGSIAYNAGQIFGGTGYSEDDILSKFYRDAAAWRFLGQPNPAIWREHGERLLRDWKEDRQHLAGLEGEAELFDQVAHRKALQAELDELRIMRNRLRARVGAWGRESASPSTFAIFHEMLARQDAHLLASKALLLRTHARLEEGLPAEEHIALFRVWLDHVIGSLREFEDECEFAVRSSQFTEKGSTANSPGMREYAQFLATPAGFDSGDFLSAPVNLAQPRFFPEMLETDPSLAELDRHYRDLLESHFGPRDGLPYERYVEQRHRPDPEDLDFCRWHGFFRMPIPKELGGEGRRKVDYYLLTTNAQRIADVSISLAIQASTSIGTTPIFLARDKDLPKARKDLAPFIGDTSLQGEIRDRLERLLKMLEFPEPKRLQQTFLDLNKRLEEAVFSRTVLKSLGHRFAEAWFFAARAGQAFDLPAFRAKLEEAIAAWKDACARAQELHAELARRQEACDLFLRWIASGQISAFALTEPSAGSDTARVATRAKLRSVPVEVEPDGVLRFVPMGGKEPRYLVDAARLEFTRPLSPPSQGGDTSRSPPSQGGDRGGVYYHWSKAMDFLPDGRIDYRRGTARKAEPSQIHFDEYDYETDDPRRMRYYDHGERRVHFTDIAQLRVRDGKLWYDYWELTGAKMWITNGRMAGVMCLYAKTAEGVTGFLVDRHAEGLVVGKDEAKMGQRGSPTNELSLQAVRVPRENVLGLEGRGQVNALETLNVGRAGLAMSSVSQMKNLRQMSSQFAVRSSKNQAGATANCELRTVNWRLDRMDEERFAAESLAFEVIGRFEHKGTKSVRMESAIAKMLVSELLHSTIELAEDIHGLAGQTELHLIEKRKRDARILNIYEGTNEIQRFFILKDLVSEIGKRGDGETEKRRNGEAGAELHSLLEAFRNRLDAGIEAFGPALWQNPNLQANCFLLAEAAAWLKALDSVAARYAWLMHPSNLPTFQPSTDLARRTLARCAGEVRRRLERFDDELTRLRRGYYASEVRAANLMFDSASQQTRAPKPLRSQIGRPLSVLAILEPAAGAVPRPHVHDGKLLEPLVTLTEADRAVLETALRLRDQGGEQVAVKVAAVGQRNLMPILREALALGVDQALLVLSPAEMTPPEQSAEALGRTLKRRGERFDLILGPSGNADLAEGLLAPLVARLLEVPFAGSCSALAVRHTDEEQTLLLLEADGERQRLRALPAAVTVEAGAPLRPFTTAGYFQALARPIELERWPKGLEAEPVRWLAAQKLAEDKAKTSPQAIQPPQAAEVLLDELGIEAGAAAATSEQAAVGGLAIQDVQQPDALNGRRVLLVLAADADGRLSASSLSAVRAIHAEQNSAGVLLFAPRDDAPQQRALAPLVDAGAAAIVILAHDPAALASPEVRARLLLECWPRLASRPDLVVGERWTESALAALRPQSERPGELALRVKRLVCEGDLLHAETARIKGNLRTARTLHLQPGHTHWLSVTDDAEVADGTAQGSSLTTPQVQRWSPRLERFFSQHDLQRLLDELKEETGIVRLADAEFIIDVGFGVGNRDGYEQVIQPLEQALKELGVRALMIGGSRKVTEELHLLPADRQIGQSGQSVNPRVLLAVGISGAPQHLSYIGPRATVIAFNRDAEAPIMTLNQRQPRPRVFPVVGDLFETVPALIAALRREQAATQPPVPPPVASARRS